MTSAAQAASNAANAQLSTGPRTAEGKAATARNAIKHGLTARDVVVAPDDAGDFETLQSSLLAELAPWGALETLTFHNLLHAAWNLHRFRRLEASLALNGADPALDPAASPTLDRLHRYAARAQRDYYRALSELRTLQTNRALRAGKLDQAEEETVPAIVDIQEFTKQSHADFDAATMRQALHLLEFDAGLRIAHIRQKRDQQNKPAAAA